MSTPSYPALLRLPTVPFAFAATALARLHYGAVSLALLLSVRDRTGSFGAAGLAVGAFAFASIAMPLKARLIDRWGQRRVLPVLAGLYGLALLAAILAPDPAVPIAAAAAGLTAPPVGPSMRARWSRLTSDATRARAFALDAAAEEALYVVSPAVAGLLAAWSPTGGLAVVSVIGVVGAAALGFAPGAPPIAAADDRARTGWRLPPGLGAGLVVALGFGAGTATLEFAVTARVVERGDDAWVGLLLGAVAVGSVVGGLVWGRRPHRRPVALHLVGLLGWLAVGAVVVAVVDPLLPLGFVLALTGLAVSPVLVVVYVAVDARTAPHRRTEANTWIGTATNLGSSAGAAIGGLVVAGIGTLWLAAAAAVPLLVATIAAPWVAGR